MTEIVDLPPTGQWEPDLRQFGHRTPYIYLPESDILFRGEPGVYHEDLMNAILGWQYANRPDLEPWSRYDTVWGSIYYRDGFNSAGPRQHAVHEFSPESKDPAVRDRIEAAVGIPISDDTGAEAYWYELESGWGQGAGGWYLGSELTADEPPDREPTPDYDWATIDDDPPDEWWKKGCPECGAEELEVHFHGGLSCPECGAEFEDLNGRLVSSIPPEPTGALWPDTLPWGEAEQDYYRNAAVRVSEWKEEEHPRDDEGRWIDSKKVKHEGSRVFVQEVAGGYSLVLDPAVAVGRRLSPRLAGFFFWSADIGQLAADMRRSLLEREDVVKLRATDPEGYRSLKRLVDGFPDQGYKLMPWAVREWKRIRNDIKSAQLGYFPDHEVHEKGTPDYEQAQRASIHAAEVRLAQLPDVAYSAARWVEYARTYNLPLPEINAKGFDMTRMRRWISQMFEDQETNPRLFKDSTTVYRFPDGWYIARVGPEDLYREGRIMQHCVGGNEYRNAVEEGSRSIFSLREPNGMPHATLSAYTDSGFGQEQAVRLDGSESPTYVYFPEIYGKQDRAPIPEYQAYLDRWYEALRERGYELALHEGNVLPDDEPQHEWIDHPEGPFSIDGLDDLEELVSHVVNEQGYQLVDEEEGYYDDFDNTYYYAHGRPLVSALGDLGTVEPYARLADAFIEEHGGNPPDVEGVDFVKQLWILAQTVVRVRLMNGNLWAHTVGPELADYLDEMADPKPHVNRATGERLFDPDPYTQAPAPSAGIKAMADYARQLAGAPTQWEETHEIEQKPDEPKPEEMSWSEWRRTWPTVQRTRPRTLDPFAFDFGQYLRRPELAYRPNIPGALSHVVARVPPSAPRRALDQLLSAGGFSLRPNGRPPEPGYYVSVEGHSQVIPLASVTENTLRNYMEAREQLVRDQPGSFFGGWVDGHGDVYLDLSTAFDSLEEAVEFARANHQEAVWDGFARTEIPVRVYDEYYREAV
jgi:hypothetical protein